jgi:hypothetical protein
MSVSENCQENVYCTTVGLQVTWAARKRCATNMTPASKGLSHKIDLGYNDIVPNAFSGISQSVALLSDTIRNKSLR